MVKIIGLILLLKRLLIELVCLLLIFINIGFGNKK